MSKKPTIIMIPGSWHTAAHAEPLIKHLQSKGYNAKAHQLGQVGIKSKRPYFEDDVKENLEVLNAELDAGRDVCLVCHSYAGMSGAEAMNRLVRDGKLEAKDGKGKLVRAVFVAAYAFPAGVPLDAKALLGPENPRFGIKDDELNTIVDPRSAFFNDIESDVEAQQWVDKLEPAYYQGATPVISSDDWRKAPITVIATRRDNAIPPERQEMVWQGFEMSWVDLGHSPFVGHPEVVVALIVKALES